MKIIIIYRLKTNLNITNFLFNDFYQEKLIFVKFSMCRKIFLRLKYQFFPDSGKMRIDHLMKKSAYLKEHL